MSGQWLKYVLTGCGAMIVVLALVIMVHNVPTGVTAQDRRAIVAFFPEKTRQSHALRAGGKPEDWQAQRRQIAYIQKRILKQVPHTERIPTNTSREPYSVLKHGHGHCHDRARLLAKIYRWLGYDVRQAYILGSENHAFALQSLLTPGAASHALLDVRTKRGWLAVGTNHRWLGIRPKTEKTVYSLTELADSATVRADIDKLPGIVKDSYLPIYGLYSRHGRYFPPYTPYIPDMNVPRFLAYLTGLGAMIK